MVGISFHLRVYKIYLSKKNSTTISQLYYMKHKVVLKR